MSDTKIEHHWNIGAGRHSLQRCWLGWYCAELTADEINRWTELTNFGSGRDLALAVDLASYVTRIDRPPLQSEVDAFYAAHKALFFYAQGFVDSVVAERAAKDDNP